MAAVQAVVAPIPTMAHMMVEGLLAATESMPKQVGWMETRGVTLEPGIVVARVIGKWM